MQPLVLLPGLGSRATAWSGVVAGLAGRFDPKIVELPGFDGAPPLRRTPTVEAYIAHVEAGLRRDGLVGSHVAGNSLGGAIALELGRRGLTASVTAIAPIGFWSSWEARYAGWALRTLQTTARAARPVAGSLLGRPRLRTVALALVSGDPASVSAATALQDAAVLAEGQDMSDIVPHTTRYRFVRGHELRTPITIAWGDRDRLLLPRQAARARTLLPYAIHVTLPGAGHVAMLDSPDEIAALIENAARAG